MGLKSALPAGGLPRVQCAPTSYLYSTVHISLHDLWDTAPSNPPPAILDLYPPALPLSLLSGGGAIIQSRNNIVITGPQSGR